MDHYDVIQTCHCISQHKENLLQENMAGMHLSLDTCPKVLKKNLADGCSKFNLVSSLYGNPHSRMA